MELLLQDELKRALAGKKFLEALSLRMGITAAELAEALTGLGPVPVTEPKSPEFGFAASSVAFTAAKLLEAHVSKAARVGPVSPAVIAEELSAAIENFSTTVGGGGFINANPDGELILKFLTDPCRRKFPFASAGISVSWENRYLKKSLAAKDAEEARLLLGAFYSRQLSQLTKDDALQFLGLLGDGELEAAPYLKGFGGRSNVPWYLARFDSATRSLKLSEAIAPAVLQEPKIARLLLAILHFRGRFRAHIEQQRPERALALTLDAVSAFFAVYNRPEIRAALTGTTQFQTSLPQGGLSQVFAVTRELVFQALASMNLPCEVPVRVL